MTRRPGRSACFPHPPLFGSGLDSLVGGGAALAFAVALLASGLSSSSVGTYAGQVVMQGFIDRRIPLFLRRALTMTPPLALRSEEHTSELQSQSKLGCRLLPD